MTNRIILNYTAIWCTISWMNLQMGIGLCLTVCVWVFFCFQKNDRRNHHLMANILSTYRIRKYRVFFIYRFSKIPFTHFTEMRWVINTLKVQHRVLLHHFPHSCRGAIAGLKNISIYSKVKNVEIRSNCDRYNTWMFIKARLVEASVCGPAASKCDQWTLIIEWFLVFNDRDRQNWMFFFVAFNWWQILFMIGNTAWKSLIKLPCE